MNILPFNKWTLTFENEEYEKLYLMEMNAIRLRYFKLLALAIIIIGTILFVIYLVNGESLYSIISMALLIIAAFISFIKSEKLLKSMNYFYGVVYFLVIGLSLFLATSYLRRSLYVLGYSTSIITAISSLFCQSSLRITLLIITPPLQLYILELYNMNDLQFIIQIFFSQLCFGLFAHYSEYIRRETFSDKILNDSFRQQLRIFLRNIIKAYLPQSLFVIRLNQRTNQFELQFQNTSGQTLMNVSDTRTLIEVFRSIYVVPKGQLTTISDNQNGNMLRSGEISMRKVNHKRQTLEEFAFHRVQETINMSQETNIINELDGIYYDSKVDVNKIINIEIGKIFFGNNALLIVIKEEKAQQITSKDEEHIKFLSTIIHDVSCWMQNSQKQIFAAISSLNCSWDQEKVWRIKCQQLLVLNKCQNYSVFINQNEIISERQKYKQVYLSSFIDNLQKFFVKMGLFQRKKFSIQFDVEDQLIKVNTKYLSQILINLYEQVLDLSDSNSNVLLTITPEINLNPLKSQSDFVCGHRKTLQGLNFIKLAEEDASESPQKFEKSKLIKFEFSFQTKKRVQLEPQQIILNPTTLEEFIYNNSAEFNLIHPITNFLIQKIGPYNKIQATQNVIYNLQQSPAIMFPSMMDLNKQSQSYLNTISFYIYTDQSQLTQSFIKDTRQKFFLEN